MRYSRIAVLCLDWSRIGAKKWVEIISDKYTEDGEVAMESGKFWKEIKTFYEQHKEKPTNTVISGNKTTKPHHKAPFVDLNRFKNPKHNPTASSCSKPTNSTVESHRKAFKPPRKQ